MKKLLEYIKDIKEIKRLNYIEREYLNEYIEYPKQTISKPLKKRKKKKKTIKVRIKPFKYEMKQISHYFRDYLIIPYNFYITFGYDIDTIQNFKFCEKIETKDLNKIKLITPTKKSLYKKYLPSDGLTYNQYSGKVRNLSFKNDLSILENFGKIGYELEHNISIWLGYHNNIDARILSDIRNLSYMQNEHNAKKSYYSLITEQNKFIIEENYINEDFRNTFLYPNYDVNIEYGLIPHKHKKTYKIFYKKQI